MVSVLCLEYGQIKDIPTNMDNNLLKFRNNLLLFGKIRSTYRISSLPNRAPTSLISLDCLKVIRANRETGNKLQEGMLFNSPLPVLSSLLIKMYPCISTAGIYREYL